MQTPDNSKSGCVSASQHNSMVSGAVLMIGKYMEGYKYPVVKESDI